MRSLFKNIIPLFIFFFFSAPIANAASEMAFSTKYSMIHYSEYSDMDDFLWRLGGERIDFLNKMQLASSYIDRIVDRVQAILGIIPRDLRFKIYLRRGRLEGDKEAYYDHKTKTIYVSVDYASQGVLAHEIAHAIIDTYFPSSAPSKIQEILSQYVDKYLWSDYQ
jgi:hypothetical protein